MKELIGTKIGMTRIFKEDGTVVPVTALEAEPNVVIGTLTKNRNGYEAARIGYGDIRAKLVNKPKAGIFAKAGVDNRRHVREVKFEGEIKVGDSLTVEMFKPGEIVDVQSTSKGLGFQGTVRRHNFGGGPVTHGQSDRVRAPGSVGQSSFPSRVFKGMKMAGHMGTDTVTAIGLRVVRVIPEKNLILVKGTVPGKNGTLVRIKTSKRKKRLGF